MCIRDRSNNVNYFDVDEWDATYGMVYKTLIDGGLDAIMGGHIMLPKYAKAINPAPVSYTHLIDEHAHGGAVRRVHVDEIALHLGV